MNSAPTFSESSNFLRIGFWIVLLSFALHPASAFSQPDTWVSVYGGYKYDRGRSLSKTHDNGYVICGNTSSYGAGNTDIYVLKTDSAGKYVWQNTLGSNNIDNSYSIQPTADSGFIVSGYTNSFGAGGYDAYLAKINYAGALEWENAYGNNDWDIAYWAVQTNDGGYILCGESFSPGYNTQAYVVRTNSTGDTLWTRTYGSTGEDAFREIYPCADGGFVMAGYATGPGGDKDFFLLKTDSAGNKLWDKYFGSTANDSCISMAICADGGFLLGGCRDTLSQHKSYLVKTDPNGNEQLFKTEMAVSGNQCISRIRETVEGHYAYLLISDMGGLGGQEIWLVKYDPTGNWYPFVSTFGGNKNEEAYDLVQNADSGYTLCGYTESFGTGPDNIFIARTDAAGSYNNSTNSYVAVNEVYNEHGSATAYPNPTTGKFKIQAQEKITSLMIYTILGKKIDCTSAEDMDEIDLSNHPNGTYLIEIYTEESVIRKKIILSK